MKRRAPREPVAVEGRYMVALRRVWRRAQGLVAQGLSPLFEVWPAATTDSTTYDPLAPRPLLPRIWNLSDDELRRLWPGIDPADVRRFAPWATARSEVSRIAYPGGRPALDDLETYVRRAISAERARQPQEPNLTRYGDPGLVRPPGAFQLVRPSDYAPVVLGADGLPIPLPPRVVVLSEEAIRRQMAWIDLSIGRLLQVERLESVVDETGRKVDRWVRGEMRRVISIDPRQADATVAAAIDGWRKRNVGLIETGLLRHEASPKLRPSLLDDVAEVIDRAHRSGLRVEYLAGELAERFGVSDSRAELIARDQVLKLNSQITKQRQQAVGITHYIWSTSRDERVREKHADLEGSLQAWATPPEVAPGRYEHPGGDYQCRCVAIPVLPGDLEAEQARRR